MLSPSNCGSYSEYTPCSTAPTSPNRTAASTPNGDRNPFINDNLSSSSELTNHTLHTDPSNLTSTTAAYTEFTTHSISDKSRSNFGSNAITELSLELNEIGSLDLSQSAVNVGIVLPHDSSGLFGGLGDSSVFLGGKTPATPATPLSVIELLGPYKKGAYGYNIPSSVNGFNFVKNADERCYSVVRAAGRAGSDAAKKERPPGEITLEMKMKKKAGQERKEVFRQALAARSEVSSVCDVIFTVIAIIAIIIVAQLLLLLVMPSFLNFITIVTATISHHYHRHCHWFYCQQCYSHPNPYHFHHYYSHHHNHHNHYDCHHRNHRYHYHCHHCC